MGTSPLKNHVTDTCYSLRQDLGCVWDCNFVEKKCDFKPNRKKIDCLETVFLKNCDLKTQKNTYLNCRQLSDFLKTQYFKRLTYDFKGQTAILPNT
jgi:hypothetical protein